MRDDLDLLTSPTGRPDPPRRLGRLLAVVSMTTLVALGACSQDPASDGVTEPENLEPGPAELPEGGEADDPTLSGDDGAPGVGDGETGGTGSGGPDDDDQ